MINTIYIIGEIPIKNAIGCKKKFDAVQLLLEERGFSVVNPMDAIINKESDIKDAFRTNIMTLMRCNSVYILPCVPIEKTQNIELLLAVELNLYILQGI